MQINLSEKGLSVQEVNEIELLFCRENKSINSDLEQIWYLIDLIWDEYGCNNKKLDWDKIGEFYSHPIWLLNGLFIEQDEISMGHRHCISDWVVESKFKNVVDYGGGFGTLARLIAQKNGAINMYIYEPHPSEFGLKRAAELENINLIEELQSGYDCLVSTDVLEHVPDPLSDLIKMIESVKVDGYLVIANCFMPVIKCHLPQTFHLKYTFNFFAKLLGLEIIGIIEGSHATIFKKVNSEYINLPKIRFYEKVSKAIYPLIEVSKPLLKPIKNHFVK